MKNQYTYIINNTSAMYETDDICWSRGIQSVAEL